jgi:hypothetical protein
MLQSATQEFLEFDHIREGIIILKNRGLRGILMTSSHNFALLPDEEKEGLIYLFQDFLNSLDFSIQIYISSRKLNITGYLDKLKTLEQNQKNELLKAQTASYRQFIEDTIATGSIMTKNFYVVVPFSVSEIEDGSQKTRGGLFRKTKLPLLTEETFQRAKTQLWQRMEFVALGLRRMGLKAVPLTTAEIIELFWSVHHPKEAEVGYFPEIPPELTIR